jgi:Hypoxia induced protein conserved region
MTSLLPYLIALGALATLAVLAMGIFSMFKGGPFNARHGNRLMRFRVVAQAVTIGLLGLFALLAGR